MSKNKRSREVEVSKLLSYVLRHNPDEFGLKLDAAGWISVDALLAGLSSHGREVSQDELLAVVANNSKQRFALSEDGAQIRANQGHSVTVALGYEPAEPPELLYHGTVERFLESIQTNGLIKGERSHVHLSADLNTASEVGARRGKPVILTVRAGDMQAAGHSFFLTPNKVWLTDHVPPEYFERR